MELQESRKEKLRDPTADHHFNGADFVPAKRDQGSCKAQDMKETDIVGCKSDRSVRKYRRDQDGKPCRKDQCNYGRSKGPENTSVKSVIVIQPYVSMTWAFMRGMAA